MFCVLLISCFSEKQHTVDNKNEVVAMINFRSKYADDHGKPLSHMPAEDDLWVTNKWNKETVAFKMTISQLDTEQDCTAIKDSNSHYKFYTTQEEGKLFIH